MAYTTINKSTDYFNTKLYTGNGAASHAITGVGFQPDFTWIKRRNTTYDHALFDAVRGVEKMLISNTTAAQNNQSNGVKAFGTDGFTVGDFSAGNINNSTYASWNWKAATYGATYYSKVEGGTQSNSDTAYAIGITAGSNGSNTWRVAVNRDSGFSIVKYTGTGSTATVGHGLGVTPKMIIFKNTSSAVDWRVYHEALGNTHRLCLNDTSASTDDDSAFNDTSPTSTLFSVGGSSSTNAGTMIAYCFAEKQGYSKFGSYVGNNNVDGTFVYTGFSPAFIMVKKTSASGNGWQLRDNKRTPYGNETKNLMYASATSAEQTTDGFDFLSNGFKWRNQAGDCNGNGDYIYMAFAEAPLVGTNDIPANAR